MKPERSLICSLSLHLLVLSLSLALFRFLSGLSASTRLRTFLLIWIITTLSQTCVSVHTDLVCVSPVRLPVLSLLPTAHSLGCRWDALGRSAEFVVEPVSDTDPEWGSSCCYLVLLRFNKREKNNGISVVIRLHHLRCRLKKRSESFFLSLFFSLLLFFLNSSSYSKRLGKSDNEHCTLPRRLQTGVSILWLRSELHSRLPCVRPCSLAENCSPNCICAYLLWYRENDTFGRRCNVLWPKSLYSFGWNVCFLSFSLRFTFFSRLQRTVSEKRLN